MPRQLVYLDGLNLPSSLASRLAYWINAGSCTRNCARMGLVGLPVDADDVVGAAGECGDLARQHDDVDRRDLYDLEDRLRALVDAA